MTSANVDLPQSGINLTEWESDARSELRDYEPFDQNEKLGDRPWDDEKLKAWEKAHNHDARTKCFAEYGCQVLAVPAARRILSLVDAIREPHEWGFDCTESHFDECINQIKLAESEVHDLLLCDDKNGRDVAELAEDIVVALRELGWTPPNVKNRIKT